MEAKGLQVWEEVLATLAGLLTLPESTGPRHPDIRAAESVMHTLLHMKAPPAAEWEALVRDAQVGPA